jgi:hypothetical protein
MLGCLLEMKQDNYGRDMTRVEIKDPEQARLLTNPESFRYFEPFLARDFVVELYKAWGKHKGGDKSKRKPYFIEFSFVQMDD